MNNFYIPYNNGYFGTIPFIPANCDKPPTIYSILETIVNGDVDLNDPAPDVKIKDLAKNGRSVIFNFDYPLSDKISKENFETQILNHYLMRRINFDTVTAFRIQLCSKLNEIMPRYNKLFDSLQGWNIFDDGEVTTRTGADNRISEGKTQNNLTNNSTTTSSTISDRRMSDTPQNQLSDVKEGKYVTQYNYDSDNTNSSDNSESNGTSTTNSTDNNNYNETIKRSPADKIRIYEEMQNNINSIYSMIYRDLDDLFYGLV